MSHLSDSACLQVYKVLSSHKLPAPLPQAAQQLLPERVQLDSEQIGYAEQQNWVDCGVFAFMALHKLCCAIIAAGDMSTASVTDVKNILLGAGLDSVGTSDQMRSAIADILLQRQSVLWS